MPGLRDCESQGGWRIGVFAYIASRCRNFLIPQSLNRESEGIPCSLTSASSIRPEPFGSELKADLLMAGGSRVAAGIFN